MRVSLFFTILLLLAGSTFTQVSGGGRTSGGYNTGNTGGTSYQPRTTGGSTSTAGNSRPTCVANCKTCQYSTCYACRDGYLETRNYYGSGGVSCDVRCSDPGCKTCSGNANYCTECKSGYFQMSPAPNLTCGKCLSGCAVCRNTQICDRCSSGRSLSEDRTQCTIGAGSIIVLLLLCCCCCYFICIGACVFIPVMLCKKVVD